MELHDPACRRCTLGDIARMSGKHACVPGLGNPDADFMFIGEAPGANEETANTPFVGPAGAILNEAFRRAQLSRDAIWLTNQVKCVIGSTAIRLPSSGEVAYRRYYEGLIVTIETARGNKLTVTPNHPILTGRGWLRADELNPVSDFVYSRRTESASRYPEVDDIPVSAEKLFGTFQCAGVTRRVVGHVMDFHGDGTANEIDIVGADSNLFAKRDAVPVPEQVSNLDLVGSLKAARDLDILRSADDPLSDGLWRPHLATTSSASGCSEFAPVIERSLAPVSRQCGRHLPVVQEGGGGDIGAAVDVDAPQSVADGLSAYTELLGDGAGGLPVEVEPDNVVNIEIDRWSGHVYNFSTPEGWYYADGIIAHNCRPPMNRTPYQTEANACMWWLVQELQVVQPKVIVAIGGASLKSLTGQSAVESNRGKVLALLPHFRSNTPVIVTPHPASALHGDATRETVIEKIVTDIGFARRLIADRTEDDGFDVVTPYQTVPDDAMPAQVCQQIDYGDTVDHIRMLAKAEWLAGDLEWETINIKGLPPGKWPWSRRQGRQPRPVAAGAAGRLGDRIIAVSVPVDGSRPELERGMRWLYEHRPMVFHNATADLIWLIGALGWDVRLGGDTMSLAAALNIESSLSLESLATLMTEMIPGWKGAVKSRGKGQKDTALLGKMPVLDDEWRKLLHYNGEDCAATVFLNEALLELAKVRQPSFRVYQNIVLPSTMSLAHAAVNGTPIDLASLDAAEKKAQTGMQQLVDYIGELLDAGERPEALVLNPRKLGNRLMQVGVPLPLTPKTGQPSVTTATLTENKGTHPAIDYLLRLSKLKKLETTYLKPWSVMIREQGDERLHTVYKPAGARTGRTSAETEGGGTLQQFPHNPKMRALVRARPGRKILSVDNSMIEVRVTGWFAGERRMMYFMQNMVDMHTIMGAWIKMMQHGGTIDRLLSSVEQWITKRPDVSHLEFANERASVLQKDLMQYLEVTPDDRYYSKPATFALIFGGHEQTLIDVAAMDYGITYTWDQAKSIRAGFFELYPDLQPWHDAQWESVRRGYTETILGRRRTIMIQEGEDQESVLRKAINTPVQATANDLALMAKNEAFSKIREMGLEDACPLIGYIHDSVMFEPTDDAIPDVSRLIIDAFENPRTEEFFGVKIPVPLIAEITTGDVWK